MIKNLAIGGGSNRVLLLVALVLGVVSAVLVGVFLSQAGGNGGGNGGVGATVPVVVTAKEVPAGTKITADMVTVKSIPTDVAVPNVFGKLEDVVGKVTRVALVSGEQIVASRLVGAGGEGQVLGANSLADVVPLEKPSAACGIDRCGQRALSVAVAAPTSSGGLIRTGDRVDVALAFTDGSAVTILQDVEVLALDQNLEKVVSGSTAQGTGGERAVVPTDEENSMATTATLAVWPDEAQKLAAGEEFTKGSQLTLTPSTASALGLPADAQPQCKGSVRLVLRHAGQQGPVELQARGVCASLFSLIWG